ncbi:ZIP family metal transporter [Oscillatoria amoena NRMC-F 0135]|jgi:zinc transporter ZupT|nr:ZIP family metal transporter [Oscillatoria amoena NRMC-F 0135]
MTLKLLVLFFTPLLSGLLVYLLPAGRSKSYRLLLVFAGAYLFGITVVHILPELYMGHGEVELIGLFVLCGFFLQQILEHFTSGVEHGHIHTHDHPHDHKHSHYHEQVSAIVLLMALCVHAFLEGAMLAQSVSGIQYDVNAVLLGIALHRAPAAFALMTVLSFQLHSKRKAVPYLIVFSIAAPIGLLISTYLVEAEILSQSGLVLLYALVSGNFLHISTTIVFESSPEHHFNARKLTVAILGALVAVAVEYFL